jgi:ABC-2 type transport system permease protein
MKKFLDDTNWIGIATLYKRETWRFLKVANQTVIAPMITTLIFLAILTLALGRGDRQMGGLPYDVFIAPGLIMMAVVQNAFANTSSSLMLQKIQGVIVDLLMPPLSAAEITFSMVMGALTRGIMVGVIVAIAMRFFVPFGLHHAGLAVFFIVISSMMLALLGMLAGIYAQTFDEVAALTNYVITPLSFLSGTFYSIGQLPALWQQISQFNPFFYMIDGFRYAITGHSDADPYIGMLVLSSITVLLWVLVQSLLARGWRLKT